MQRPVSSSSQAAHKESKVNNTSNVLIIFVLNYIIVYGNHCDRQKLSIYFIYFGLKWIFSAVRRVFDWVSVMLGFGSGSRLGGIILWSNRIAKFLESNIGIGEILYRDPNS